MHKPPRLIPLPDTPQGVNPFAWITRMAPVVREARRQAAELYRMEQHHANQEDARPTRPGPRA